MTEFTYKKKGKSKSMPNKIVIFGVPKVGKSSLASQFPNVLFIDVEGGLDYLENEVMATDKIESFDDILRELKRLHDSDKKQFDWIAIDSLDWCEDLAQERLVKAYNAESIVDKKVADFAYYNGVISAASDTKKIFKWLDAIYKKHGTKALFICHSKVETVNLPGKEPYSRHQLDTSKYVASHADEWADLMVFLDFSFHVTKNGKKEVLSEPKPVIKAGSDPSFIGGGRMKLSKEIPVSYEALEKEIAK